MDPLTTTFAALADPTRRAILARLALGETSVTELAEPFQMSMPAVSKHLKVLQRAGLITRGREAQWRPCKLEAAPLQSAARWIEEYSRFWEESLDRLEEYLSKIQAQGQTQIDNIQSKNGSTQSKKLHSRKTDKKENPDAPGQQ